MRKNLGAKPFTYPQPVFIIAAYDENGLPNAMNAAEITDKLGLHSLRQRHWYLTHLLIYT